MKKDIYIIEYIKNRCKENFFLICLDNLSGTSKTEIISPKTNIIIVKEKKSTKIIVIPN